MLAHSPGGLSVTELAAAVDVNRTVVYRLVATLEQHGLARRDTAGKLHVGLGVLRWPAACSRCCASWPRPCCARSPRSSVPPRT